MKDELKNQIRPKNSDKIFLWIYIPIILGIVFCFSYWQFFGMLPRHTSNTPIQLCIQSLFGPLLFFVSGVEGGGVIATVATAIMCLLVILSWCYRKHFISRLLLGVMLFSWVVFGSIIIEVVSMMGL